MVPGHRPKMLVDSLTSGADALVWDIADVPSVYRSIAREFIEESLRSHVRNERVFLRINHPKLRMLNYDLKVLNKKVNGIIIPEVENSETVLEVVEELEKLTAISPFLSQSKILVGIGSALGIYNANAILGSTEKIDALVFDSQAFCSESGISPGTEGKELIYARSRLIMEATLAGVPVIDSYYMESKKDEDLITACTEAKRMGFKSKMAIYPNQIPFIKTVFNQ